MRALSLAVLGGLSLLALWLWGFGGDDMIFRWAGALQRETQNAMAVSLRALRRGEPGALLTLWGLCATYGFVHAAGPGHGKVVIGGYGLGARVAARRLMGLALLSSLAQAAVAVVLTLAALGLLGWGRERLTGAAERVMAPTSYGLIACLGLWILVRGVRSALAHRRSGHATHDHTHVCATCGHAHAPTAEEAADATGWRDVLAIVTVIAVRPCTGAIFLLILTHALGLLWAGIVGTFVMGIGTAAFTAVVAMASVGLRESAVAQVAGAEATHRLLAAGQILAGGVIAALAVQLLSRSLGL